jgi:precorrin-2 dehydrogenase/sirohydrochlorin ferrochelatase
MIPTDRADLYPVLLDVSGRLVVVFGANRSAVRTAAAMAAHGANVVVISPEVPDSLLAMEAAGTLTIESRSYVRGDLEGAFIAVSASGSEEVDAAVADEATERNVLLNVQRDGTASNFIIPSVVRRGHLQIAVSTGGVAPSVARQVRRGIAEAHGWEWGRYVELVGELRTLAMRKTGLSDAGLAPLFEFVNDSDLLYRIRSEENVTAGDVYAAYLASLEEDSTTTGGDFA